MTTIHDLSWEPPGPGSWQLLADHYPRPVTRAMEPFAEVWSREATAFMKALGMPLRDARMAQVNGLPYISIRTAGGSSRRPPPGWVLKLAVKVVPTLRRSERTMRHQLEHRPWVQGIARWYDVDRPKAIERMLEIARADPGTLDDEALADHLSAVEVAVFDAASQHMALHGHDSAPPGLFAARALDWGIDLPTATALLSGASPASTGRSDELDRLRRAVAGRSAADLEGLRALDPEVSAALDDYLEMYGWRLIDGYDVDCRTLVECPSMVLALATSTAHVDDGGHFEQRRQAARQIVPADEREEFDRLLADARAAYGVRDDNGAILISWPVGLLRRCMLAAGRRLAALGVLDDPGLAIEASVAELVAALRSSASLDQADLAARAAHRRRLRASDAPRALGPEEPPPPENLPGALGTLFRAITIFGLGATPDNAPLHGLGIGDEPYEGRARLVLGGGVGVDDFEEGDVLVAPMTSPSYNLVLSLAGAVVTEEGTVMSHAAIMARELGLPAVVGAPGAVTLINDGDRVRVDPVAGTVKVIAG